jgi:Leucine-rich repeat (LRR) protein
LDGIELRDLDISGTKIRDLSLLRGQKSLRKLRAHRCPISNLDLLVDLPNLDTLDIDATKISDLSPLSNSIALRKLDADNTRITDLSPISNLLKLEELNFSSTQVSDLAPVAFLANLKGLSARSTKIVDTTALEALTKLERLYIGSNQIVDIGSVRNLAQLKLLSIRNTNVFDISALASLVALLELDISGTLVSDISPLRDLQKLRELNLERSQVSDLEPIAELEELVYSIGSFGDGLGFYGCPISDPKVLDFSALENPDRTVLTVNYLRSLKGLSAIFPPSSRDEDEGVDEQTKLPGVPTQGPGPHFAVREDGIIDFAPSGDLDQEGNNVARLRELHPLLLDLTRSLIEALGQGNIPHGYLRERVQDYQAVLSVDVEALQFGRLFGVGVRLQNAAAITIARVSEGELPPLDTFTREALDSVQDLHGAFILSTRDGAGLIAAEERYKRRPHEEEEFRRAVLELAQQFESRPDIIDQGAAGFVRLSIEEIGEGDNPERSWTYASSATRNATIVVISGATIGALPVVGGMIAGPPGLVFGGLAALVGIEGLKKSKAFTSIANALGKSVDQLSDVELQQVIRERANRLVPYVNFVVKLEPVLRKIAGKHTGFRWIRRSLDWIMQQKEAGKHDFGENQQ